MVEKSSGVEPNTTKALKDLKILPVKHKSKKLTKTMINNYDLVLTMEQAHKAYIKGFDNVFSLGEYVDGIDVIDPYDKDFETYKKTAKLLMFMLDELIQKIVEN